MTSTHERLDLMDAAIYGDVFDCAVTLDELWRFARKPIERAELRMRISREPLLESEDGFYCLSDRRELLGRRSARARRAHLLERRARRIARFLRHAPFVRAIALTGSAAAGDAGDGDDIDFLVAVEPGRIATTFLLLGSAARVFRRWIGCPNYYISADRLAVRPMSVYIAREVVQAQVLVGEPDLIRRANPWLDDSFPNLAAATPKATIGAESRVRHVLEWPLRDRVGDRLERWARGIASKRLRVHYQGLGQDVPAEVEDAFESGDGLRFHGGGVAERTTELYEARRAALARRVEEREPVRTVP